ncbi:DUF6506 family protein [Azospirillum sp. ST 5-10]|uniref:DUF6506 family protein n=1 Tax=unclassified Azospirillum TaxID=2630922 RepID=UPI003F4A0BFD
MTLRAAFLFLAPGADPAVHRGTVRTPEVEVVTVGVADYRQAEAAVHALLDEGVQAFELCGGFGNAGVARIARAVAGRAAVGVVRFDGHPGLGGKSGDDLFAG